MVLVDYPHTLDNPISQEVRAVGFSSKATRY